MSKSKSNQRENKRQRRCRWLLIGGGIVATIAIGVLLLAPRSAAPATTAINSSGDDRAIGPATAPITIVEYADFGCTLCRAWHNAGILQQVINQYGDNVRFVWRDFPGHHTGLAQGRRGRPLRLRSREILGVSRCAVRARADPGRGFAQIICGANGTGYNAVQSMPGIRSTSGRSRS